MIHDPPPRLLARLRRICTVLPGAYEERAWAGIRWMVAKRNFAHALRITGGKPAAYAKAAGRDGVVLTFRVDRAFGEVVRASDSDLFFAGWGTKWRTHVVGLCLDAGTDWTRVTALVHASHALLAP